MRRTNLNLGLIALCLCCLVGCRKEDTNPELLDPIFKDLDKRASDSQKGLDDEKKHQDELVVFISRAEAHSLELRNAKRDLAKSKMLSSALEQDAHYYQIRAKRRMLEDRINYKAAFAKKENWPDPREYSDYLTNSRLRQVNLNWNAHVPKLQSRLSTVAAKPEKEKAKGE